MEKNLYDEVLSRCNSCNLKLICIGYNIKLCSKVTIHLCESLQSHNEQTLIIKQQTSHESRLPALKGSHFSVSRNFFSLFFFSQHLFSENIFSSFQYFLFVFALRHRSTKFHFRDESG